MKTYLKIKIMSLAAEARIIRREQKRWPDKAGVVWQGLHHHRVNDVRNEARAALLAYGFLRGRDYSRMEAKAHNVPNFGRVGQLVEKYGDGDLTVRRIRFKTWRDQAFGHLTAQVSLAA